MSHQPNDTQESPTEVVSKVRELVSSYEHSTLVEEFVDLLQAHYTINQLKDWFNRQVGTG